MNSNSIMLVMILKFVVLYLPFVQACSSANILGVFGLPSLSHFMMFRALLMELARRGHNVDVVSHFPLNNPIERYNDISIRGSAPIATNSLTVDEVRSFVGINLIKTITWTYGTETCAASFKSPQLQELRKSNKKYDLVITELFGTDCMVGWAWHFGVPSVVMTSSVNLPWSAERFGLPDNPSYIPNYAVDYEENMTLYEKIVNTWTLIQAKAIYYWYSTRPSNILAKQFFGESMPDLDVLVQNTSLQLVNTHFTVNNARPMVPNVVEVAGLHIEKPKPVDLHFNKVLNTDRKGVIYFSLGSLILTETMPIETVQGMFDAFSELPYKVVWRAKKENFPKGLRFPENIHFEPWLPQLDLLCDPRVKLFVSHGGQGSTLESVYCGVPVLGIPVFADQSLNIKHAVARGFAELVNYDDISKDTILRAVEKLLQDPKYARNAKQISEEFKDRPQSAMDTAVFWIEYVIRHKGAPRMQSYAKKLTWYQYYLLDVIFITVVVPILTFIIFILSVRLYLKSSTKKAKIS